MSPNLPSHDDRESNYSSSPTAPTILYAASNIVMGYFSEHEINTVAECGSSPVLKLTFFGICFGAFISLVGVWISGVQDPTKHMVCLALMAVFGLQALYFGIAGFSEKKEAEKKLNEFKQRFRSVTAK